MFGFLKKESKLTKQDISVEKVSHKQTAAVFVDYEHWYYGYNNFFKIRPNVSEWYDEIQDQYDVRMLKVFGNFSEKKINNEIQKLEKITDNVIYTASMKDGVDKDFTDFVMLDSIYRAAAMEDSPNVFIIFSGDGHFDIVIKYLKELKKRVIVYGVKHSFSARLRSSATAYVEMPRNEQELSIYYDMIFSSLRLLQKKGKIPTYKKTVAGVSQYHDIMPERIQSALDYLMKNQYIIEKELKHNGRPSKVLNVKWDKVKEDGIWKK